MTVGVAKPKSSPTGCLSVLKVGRSMVVITDNQGVKKVCNFVIRINSPESSFILSLIL